MGMFKIGWVLVFSLGISLFTWGQGTQEQLANQYFQQGEFEKAEVIYLKLLSDNPHSQYFYEQLLSCFSSQKKYEDAIKMIKKTSRKNEEKPFYLVDLYWMYGLAGDKTQKEKTAKELLKKLPQNDDIIQQTLQNCLKREVLELGKDVLIQGRLLLGQPERYRLELGDVYRRINNIPLMLEEYLTGAASGSILMEDLEQRLSLAIEDSVISIKVAEGLLDKVRKNPESENLTELLTWYYIQQKNFKAAFIQRKAQDKKQKTEGGRILELARIALESESHEDARQMVAYVTAIGEQGRWYEDARTLELEILKKIILSSQYKNTDIEDLTKAFQDFLSRRGINNQTAKAIRELAELEAYYLHRTDSAILRLETLTENPRIHAKIRSECKLFLGDLYLQTGDYYTPVLLYGQVDTEFKEDALGREAKFRNARLSYFKGEFEWAKAQLDVLKTATSQLISNDAIALSVKIQENTGSDSTEEAMQIFADAELLAFQKKYDSAWILLDTILARFPEHPLVDNVWMTRAEICKAQKKYTLALQYYQEVYTRFGQDVLADNALMEAAEIYEQNFQNPSAAAALYEKVVLNYPGSLYALEAGKKYRLLKQLLNVTP